MKTPLGTEVDLGPGHIVLDGDPTPPRKRGTAASPLFGPCLLWPRSPISAAAELLLLFRLWSSVIKYWIPHCTVISRNSICFMCSGVLKILESGTTHLSSKIHLHVVVVHMSQPLDLTSRYEHTFSFNFFQNISKWQVLGPQNNPLGVHCRCSFSLDTDDNTFLI